MGRKKYSFRMFNLAVGAWCEDFPVHLEDTAPSDLFGPRSRRNPVKRYSPCFMTEMFGAGVREVDVSFSSKKVQYQSVMQAAANPKISRDPNSTKERVIFDPDDSRKAIPDTRFPPWRSICQLKTLRIDGSIANGTGWLAAPRVVVTAGHCIFDKDGVEPSVVHVTPGLNRNGAPFLSQSSSKVYVHDRWKHNFDDAFDYGLIVLPDSSLALQTGWFGVVEAGDDHLRNLLVKSAGYPRDAGNINQLMAEGRIVRSDKNFIYHSVDTAVGQSGSPVFHTDPTGRRTVVGIHTDGFDTQTNRAVRITSVVFDQIQAAAKKFPHNL